MRFCLLLLSVSATNEDAEARFLKYREGLSSGAMKVSVSLDRFSQEGAKKTEKRHWRIWFDESHYRCDQSRPEGAKSLREIYCENCERDDCYVYFNEKHIGKKIFPVTVGQMKVRVRVGATLKIDPRVFGTTTTPIFGLHDAQLTEALARTDRTAPVWTKGTWQGKDSLVQTYRLNHGPNIRATFVPDWGDSMVRCELNHGDVAAVLESKPRQFGAKRHWFPERITSQQTKNGKLAWKYELDVSEASFNEAIPPSTFKLIDMQVPAGTDVSLVTPDANGAYYWDGKKIVQKKGNFAAAFPDVPPTADSRGNWLPVASVSLAVVGLLAFGAFYLRRKNGHS